MKVIFLGRKQVGGKALDRLIRRGAEVLAVVSSDGPDASADPASLPGIARSHNLPLATDEEVYEWLQTPSSRARFPFTLENADLVVSFLHRRRIRPALLQHARIAAVNFHPAPLPEYRGLGGYNFGIYEGAKEWGVSAHHMDPTIDSGDIIRVHRFPIDPTTETAQSLEEKSRTPLLELFEEVIDRVLREGRLPRIPQGPGRYITRKDFERLRTLRPEDTAEEIHRKIRAFWFPPFPGACTTIGGEEFTLVDADLLRTIARRGRE